MRPAWLMGSLPPKGADMDGHPGIPPGIPHPGMDEKPGIWPLAIERAPSAPEPRKPIASIMRDMASAIISRA